MMQKILASLSAGHDALAARYPGDSGARQPVHTVYGGGHLFKAETAKKLGTLALRALTEHAPTPDVFADAMGLPAAGADTVHARVIAKLEREAVEDFRIDFEDGYGSRPDAEEDKHAVGAAKELGRGLREGSLPPFIGLRVKPLTRELAPRALRTLNLFVTTLVEQTGGGLPANFVVTLPKLQFVHQVTAFVDALDLLENKLDLAAGALRLELMVEQTQTLFTADGRCALPLLHDAARGRLVGAHFGTYDYTAAVGITAAHQHHGHAAADFARNMMQVAFAGTGVFLSDGATNVLPVGSREAVHRAWRLHAGHVRRSLEHGFTQGWDLHPAQLPSRYAAVFAFFLEGLPAMTERLRNFVDKAAQATLVDGVFDDAATGQGLLNFFLRGLSCGALTEVEALATGLSLAELRSQSFGKIVTGRHTSGGSNDVVG